MAYDEGLAQLLRDDLAGETVREQKMFGGLAFMLHGHMVCGTYRDKGMFRVGKDATGNAAAIPGASVMAMGGRTMPGMIETEADLLADDARRSALMAMAVGFVRSLPPKTK